MSLTFILIGRDEKRVLEEIDTANLDGIIGALSEGPATIDEFDGFYEANTGKKLYDKGNLPSGQFVNMLKKHKGGADTQEILTKLEGMGMGSKKPNYIRYAPDEETPYDIPKTVDEEFLESLRGRITALIVDLRTQEARYISANPRSKKVICLSLNSAAPEPVAAAQSNGPYRLSGEWSVVSYSLQERESER
ncbi:hypothetical protein KY360_01235 [Candidatus Woesearchaeota archaeon]|nr:hypothetical protein [Candidatus Woesearchaeota archaeon]